MCFPVVSANPSFSKCERRNLIFYLDARIPMYALPLYTSLLPLVASATLTNEKLDFEIVHRKVWVELRQKLRERKMCLCCRGDVENFS